MSGATATVRTRRQVGLGGLLQRSWITFEIKIDPPQRVLRVLFFRS